MNKNRDIDADGIRPLDARSLALSALLGTHPPALPAASLVALAELFGIAPGSMRTALSRMAARDEVAVDDGWYRLAGPLLDRQRSQDTGRRPADHDWHGDWHTAIATDDRRTVTERRRFRHVMTAHRFAELRPDIWMRPANLPAPPTDAGWLVVTGRLDLADTSDMVARLWDLHSIAARARSLGERLAAVAGTHDDTPGSIPARFEVAAAVLRFLRSEPLLPPVLLAPARIVQPWPVDDLRRAYAVAEADLQRDLRAFFESRRAPA